MKDATLEMVIVDLLSRIPERWQEFHLDALSEQECQALLLLTAAEMVERRIRMRLQMLNHRVVVDATVTATGEYGLVEGLGPVVASIWEEWQPAFAAWQASATKATCPFHVEQLEPHEWRLTASGVLARRDVAAGRQTVVADFVLSRGFFSGRPRLVEDQIVGREPVRGRGKLITLKKTMMDTSPSPVAVANWEAGAVAFATAFVKQFETQSRPPQPTGAARHDDRKIETDARLKRYLTDRVTQYEQLVDSILAGDSDARIEFRELFGPTAFAKHVVCENGHVAFGQEFQRIKTAVQHTPTYRNRIKPVLSGQPPKFWEAQPEDDDLAETIDVMYRRAGR